MVVRADESHSISRRPVGKCRRKGVPMARPRLQRGGLARGLSVLELWFCGDRGGWRGLSVPMDSKHVRIGRRLLHCISQIFGERHVEPATHFHEVDMIDCAKAV